MKNEHYPALYRAADRASMQAQKYYLIISGIDLLLMVIAAILAVYNYTSETGNLIVYVISGLFLLTSLILTIILRSKSFEDIWYQGRAMAESVKTLTWRFVTCSELFESHLDKKSVNALFIDRLREMTKEFKGLNRAMDTKILALPNITPEMERIRALSMEERKQYYIEYRIGDQKRWYTSKSEFNRNRYNYWYAIIIITQFLSLVSIVILIKYPLLNWNLVGVFTTLSAAALSWLQLKQHQSLKQAYTTAAQELGFIESLSAAVSNENDLSGFVLDSENAISREHTLWLAQRRK